MRTIGGQRCNCETGSHAHVGKSSVQDSQVNKREKIENTYAKRGERTRENIRIRHREIYVSCVREKRERVLIKICGVAGDNENYSRLNLFSYMRIPYQPVLSYWSTTKYNNFLHNYF
jgi:hypothetical protein